MSKPYLRQDYQEIINTMDPKGLLDDLADTQWTDLSVCCDLSMEFILKYKYKLDWTAILVVRKLDYSIVRSQIPSVLLKYELDDNIDNLSTIKKLFKEYEEPLTQKWSRQVEI